MLLGCTSRLLYCCWIQKPPLSERKEFAVCSVAEWNSHQRQVFSVFFTVVQRLHADLGEDGGELQPAELLSGKPVQILPSPRHDVSARRWSNGCCMKAET